MIRSTDGFLFFFTSSSLVFSSIAAADSGPWHGNMWGNWGAGHMTFGILPMALFWLFLVVFIVILIRWTTNDSNTSNRSREDTALRILRERFARGEIDKNEYEELKRVLLD